MPYITERIAHDADAHIFEPPGWLNPYITEQVRQQAQLGYLPEVEPSDGESEQARHVPQAAEHVRHGRPVAEHAALVQAQVADVVTQQPAGHRHHRRTPTLVSDTHTGVHIPCKQVVGEGQEA